MTDKKRKEVLSISLVKLAFSLWVIFLNFFFIRKSLYLQYYSIPRRHEKNMVVAEADDRMQHVDHEKSQNAEIHESQSSITSDEIFTCNQCMNSFEDRDTLFKHVKQAHQQHVYSRRRFKCDQCERTFKSMSGLRNHARTHSVFFGANAEAPSRLSFGPVHPVLPSTSDTSKHSSNEDAVCTMDSTFTVEKEFDSSVYHYNDVVCEQSEKTEARVSGSRDTCDSVRADVRRRSGIPLPVRRSLLADKEPMGLYKDSSEAFERASVHAKKADETDKIRESATTSREITRESRRLTRVIHTEYIQEAKQNVHRASIFKSRTPKSRPRTPAQKSKICTERALRLKSPFGTKYTTKVESPLTSRNRNRSKSRTPQKGPRTPKSGKHTALKGKRTPASSKTDSPANKGYNCMKCGKSFVDKSKLDVHFAVHARETPEKCGIPKYALKKTPSKQKASPFVTESLDWNSKSFSCKQCGRAYEKKTNLDAHVKTHDVNTPFSCAYCDKKFRFLSSLKAHSFVHQGESRDQSNTLTLEHKRTPAEKSERRYDITYNSLKFNIFSVLPSGENPEDDSLISDDLPFVCKICSYQTCAPAELLIHMKTHSKSGPFTCTHCCKSYKLQKNLKMHEKVHTINRLKKLLIENTINKTASQSMLHI
ncbi:zinc finger protein 91-like [Mercenaria mercenaria]|uniref:zinc finger protein 91-like n=1 Tax=Mercenaria mercenaria TaxID=6596 RepID=UPI00234E3CF2|nr:zinc finger protein 91-like [Mercenaria mercenaria]